MLRVRAEQFQAFQDVTEAAFVGRLARLLRETLPDAVVRLPDRSLPVGQLSDVDLRTLVRAAVGRGREHGLTWEKSIGSFVALMFAVAPNFDREPLARRALADPEIPAQARVEVLFARMTERAWQRCRDDYDPRRWDLGERE